MKERIVTDDDVDRALSFLRDSAIEVGHARSTLIKAEHMVQHIEALMMLASEEKSTLTGSRMPRPSRNCDDSDE